MGERWRYKHDVHTTALRQNKKSQFLSLSPPIPPPRNPKSQGCDPLPATALIAGDWHPYKFSRALAPTVPDSTTAYCGNTVELGGIEDTIAKGMLTLRLQHIPWPNG